MGLFNNPGDESNRESIAPSSFLIIASMIDCLNSTAVRRGGLTTLLMLVSSLALAQENGLLKFVQPLDGQVFAPGDTVAVKLTVDQSIAPDRVVLFPSFGSSLEAVDWTNGPYEITYIIPESFDGEISLGAFAMDADHPDVGLSEANIEIQVRPSISPIGISVSQNRVIQSLPEPYPDDEQIYVNGNYPGGENHSLNFAGSGINFQSIDPSVATVDALGNVSGQSEGRTFVKITYGNLTEWVEVVIYTPGGPTPPPTEHTGDVTIAAGGFRYDPDRDEFIQRVVITNAGNEPIHRPLVLLLDGLPEGIDVLMASETKSILPLNTPWVDITDFSGLETFLSPGESASVEIAFINPSGVPISYVPKLYTAEQSALQP